MVNSIHVGRTIKGVFQKRLNRFLALVRVGAKTYPCFLPNPGRMNELLILGTEVVLKEVLKEDRKTCCDVIGILQNGQIVSIDSRLPNKLVLKALKTKAIEILPEVNTIKTEYSYGQSRFDFFLSNNTERCLLEVKSCTLVKDGVAMFPDAETVRGRRHVNDLVKAKKEGYRACIIFIIQRTDAYVFVPNDETDPKFGKALRNAALEGVEVYAYFSEFVQNRVALKEKVRVDLASE